jgi:hypothetical protein
MKKCVLLHLDRMPGRGVDHRGHAVSGICPHLTSERFLIQEELANLIDLFRNESGVMNRVALNSFAMLPQVRLRTSVLPAPASEPAWSLSRTRPGPLLTRWRYLWNPSTPAVGPSLAAFAPSLATNGPPTGSPSRPLAGAWRRSWAPAQSPAGSADHPGPSAGCCPHRRCAGSS